MNSRKRGTDRAEALLVDLLAESARAFEDQRVDLAIVRGDIAMPVDGQTVLIMRRNAAVLLAPAGSALHDVEDLKGRKIGILQTEQAGRPDDDQALLDAALTQSDVPLASVGRAPLTLAELPDAIERHDIDAVLAIGTPGSANLTEAVAAVSQAGHGPPVFIPISEAKAIAQRLPTLEFRRGFARRLRWGAAKARGEFRYARRQHADDRSA